MILAPYAYKGLVPPLLRAGHCALSHWRCWVLSMQEKRKSAMMSVRHVMAIPVDLPRENIDLSVWRTLKYKSKWKIRGRKINMELWREMGTKPVNKIVNSLIIFLYSWCEIYSWESDLVPRIADLRIVRCNTPTHLSS